jgi:PAS domain S-box-containing protein
MEPEDAFTAILHQHFAGVVQTDLEGRFLVANRRWCEMLGYSEEEIMGMTVEDITHPDNREATRQNFARLVETGAGYVMEKKYLRKDGAAVWAVANVTPVRDASGKALSIYALVIDITERKTAERRAAFLADLAQALAPLREEKEIVAAAVAALGSFMNAHRSYFVECLEREGRIVVGEEWVRDGAPSLVGSHSLYDFGGTDWWRQYASGDFKVNDVEEDPLTRDQAANYAPLRIRSYAVQPFKCEGPWTVCIAVTDDRPRTWSAEELALMEHVVARVWPLVERARADQALLRVTSASERNRRLYETILGNTPDLVYVFGLDHRFIYANPALLKVWGRTFEDSIGKNCLELGYPAWHAEMHDREVDQVVATKAPIRGEVSFSGTQGTRTYDYIFVPVIGADGEVEAVAGTTRDVTERKQSEAVLASQASTLELIVSGAPLGAVLNALCELVDHHARESLSASILLMQEDGIHLRPAAGRGIPEEWSRFIDPLAIGPSAGACGTAAHRSEPVICSDITTDPLWAAFVDRALAHGFRSCWSTPILSSAGKVLGTFAIYHGVVHTPTPAEIRLVEIVTRIAGIAIERKQAEEGMRAQTETLREADRKKDNFIALLAHELRNPLAPLRSGLEVMRLSANDPAVMAKTRSMMDRQLGHMVRLVDDLLDVSRISLNKMELRRSRVLLANVVANAVETARPAIEAAGHQLTVSLPPEPIALEADLTRLAQVLSNLLTNSAKYTPRGGRITLTAQHHGEEVAIAVSDNGIGIPADALQTVFQMFSQVDRQFERMTGGLGIGLALVKGLTEMHGGTVTAESAGEGRGSVFTVRLPVTLPEARLDDAPGDDDASRARALQRRVLVVDDNRDAAGSMALMLRLLGNEVHTAHDGVEAVEAACRLQPHIVLMDLGMPRLNGHEATRRIRAQPWGREMTVIALTGWGQDADRVKSREAGCDGHLVKPVALSDLQKLLAELTPRSATTPL